MKWQHKTNHRRLTLRTRLRPWSSGKQSSWKSRLAWRFSFSAKYVSPVSWLTQRRYSTWNEHLCAPTSSSSESLLESSLSSQEARVKQRHRTLHAFDAVVGKQNWQSENEEKKNEILNSILVRKDMHVKDSAINIWTNAKKQMLSTISTTFVNTRNDVPCSDPHAFQALETACAFSKVDSKMLRISSGMLRGSVRLGFLAEAREVLADWEGPEDSKSEECEWEDDSASDEEENWASDSVWRDELARWEDSVGRDELGKRGDGVVWEPKSSDVLARETRRDDGMEPPPLGSCCAGWEKNCVKIMPCWKGRGRACLQRTVAEEEHFPTKITIWIFLLQMHPGRNNNWKLHMKREESAAIAMIRWCQDSKVVVTCTWLMFCIDGPFVSLSSGSCPSWKGSKQK